MNMMLYVYLFSFIVNLMNQFVYERQQNILVFIGQFDNVVNKIHKQTDQQILTYSNQIHSIIHFNQIERINIINKKNKSNLKMKGNKSKKILNKKQLSSIGYNNISSIPQLYWNEKIQNNFKSYKSIPSQRKHLQNQSFQEFKNMTLDGANSEGTGRFQFQDIEKIQFSIIYKKEIISNMQNRSKKELKNQKIKQKQTSQFEQTQNVKVAIKQIQTLITSFFNIQTKYNPKIKLSINSRSNLIEDEKKMIEFQVNCGSGNIVERPTYDFWELFDVGMRYKQDYSVKNKNKRKQSISNNNIGKQFKNSIQLFFIQADLMEEDNPVDGRATGDGIAFVSFKKEDFDLIDLQTTFLDQQYPCYPLPLLIHECLHTLGFEHCSAWQCLMNSVTNNQFMLCPCCIRKLQDQISWKINLKGWYQSMLQTLSNLRQTMEQLYGNKKCLRLFADLLYSKDQIRKRLSKSEQSSQQTICKTVAQIKDYSMKEKCHLILDSLQK